MEEHHRGPLDHHLLEGPRVRRESARLLLRPGDRIDLALTPYDAKYYGLKDLDPKVLMTTQSAPHLAHLVFTLILSKGRGSSSAGRFRGEVGFGADGV
jgi:hypothetical protein